jgi:hypothetical protein
MALAMGRDVGAVSGNEKPLTNQGLFRVTGGERGFTRAIHGPRPTGSFAVRIGNPADASNPVGIRPPTALRQIRKSPLSGALAYLAERGGWDRLRP